MCINGRLLPWLPHPLALCCSLWKNFIQLHSPLQSPSIRAARVCNGCWLHPWVPNIEVPRASPGASQGTVKEPCWRRCFQAGLKREERMCQAALGPAALSISAAGQRRNRGKRSLWFTWRCDLQSHICHRCAPHPISQPGTPHGKPVLQLPTFAAGTVCVSGKGYVSGTQHPNTRQPGQRDQIQLHWEGAPEGIGRCGKETHNYTICRASAAHPGRARERPETPFPVNLHL